MEYTNERDPAHPVGFANYGLVLIYAGRYEEAVASYRKTLALSPDYGMMRYDLGHGHCPGICLP
jgi:tetratricopeptide (TPR) repeat protein